MSAGLRLVLAVAIPLAGAAACYELRGTRRWALGVALATIAVCASLTASLVVATGGGAVENRLGAAIPGVDVTARADSATVAIILAGSLAAALAAPRRTLGGGRPAGLLLCLAGLTFTAAAGNLALLSGGVAVIAGGTLMVRGRKGPGSRSTTLIASTVAVAALALMAAAAQLVATAGTSDLAFIPQSAVGGASAVPWAIAGALLVLTTAIPGEGAGAARDWAAVAALPAGYLVLLRLQEATGGQPPGVVSVVLAVIGASAAAAAVVTGRRATTVAAVGRAGPAVMGGLLVALFSLGLGTTGTVCAGLFLFLEAGLLAAPAWDRRPTAWSAASVAALAVPGGFAFAVAVTALAAVAHRGVAWFALLAVLTAVVAGAAVLAARVVAMPRAGRSPRLAGAVIAVAAGAAGGVGPGLALRMVATPLAGGAPSVDLDPGALAVPGGGAAAGYLTIAAMVLLAGAVSALVLTGEGAVGAPLPEPRPGHLPPVVPLLRIRRRVGPGSRSVAALAHRLDAWLEAQPGVPLVLAVTALALLVIR